MKFQVVILMNRVKSRFFDQSQFRMNTNENQSKSIIYRFFMVKFWVKLLHLSWLSTLMLLMAIVSDALSVSSASRSPPSEAWELLMSLVAAARKYRPARQQMGCPERQPAG